MMINICLAAAGRGEMRRGPSRPFRRTFVSLIQSPIVIIVTTITNQQGPLDSRNQHFAALSLMLQPGYRHKPNGGHVIVIVQLLSCPPPFSPIIRLSSEQIPLKCLFFMPFSKYVLK